MYQCQGMMEDRDALQWSDHLSAYFEIKAQTGFWTSDFRSGVWCSTMEMFFQMHTEKVFGTRQAWKS